MEIQISPHISNMIWRLDTDRIGYRNVISYILSHNLDIDNEKFKNYQEEYLKVNYAFEIAKKEIINKYAPNTMNKQKWKLDYFTGILSIEEDESL